MYDMCILNPNGMRLLNFNSGYMLRHLNVLYDVINTVHCCGSPEDEYLEDYYYGDGTCSVCDGYLLITNSTRAVQPLPNVSRQFLTNEVTAALVVRDLVERVAAREAVERRELLMMSKRELVDEIYRLRALLNQK
jgi:hypothetical protein